MGLAVYVHIPYCAAKCRYCDFLSLPLHCAAVPPGHYLLSLEAELALRGRELREQQETVATLYIGGGTPTVLEAAELEHLFAMCRRLLPLACTEWTVEANPGSLTEEKMEVLSSAGISRISLGVQDLDDARLALLGRTHDARTAAGAFALCRKHIPAVSVDLMSGLPGQSVCDWLHTLDTVCAWRPDHLSVYGLKSEEGTWLASRIREGTVVLPDEDVAAEMLPAGRERLAQYGYEQYELANFALPGYQSRHNLTYWRNQPYLGAGLGAHSYWGGKRFCNTGSFTGYYAALAKGVYPVAESNFVTPRQEMEDTMMLGLRLMDGVGYDEFTRRFGCDLRDVFDAEIARLTGLGLLCAGEKRCFITEKGYPLANLVFAEFISA